MTVGVEIKPFVSVRFMVYNNEPYIREAIEGILMQKTNFKVEIVVGDDFSTDKTLEIIRSYNDTENINIKILDRPVGGEYWLKRKERNASVRTNFVNIIENCSGKYIALLDGDDYWTDPLKLQKQVDFLEANADYSICFHDIMILRDGMFFQNNITTVPKSATTTIEDLSKGNYIMTGSTLFRRALIHIPNFFFKLNAGDYPLFLILANKGKIYFFNEKMSVYRIHSGGIFSNANPIKLMKGNVYLLEKLTFYFKNDTVKTNLKLQLNFTLNNLFTAYRFEHDFFNLFLLIIKYPQYFKKRILQNRILGKACNFNKNIYNRFLNY